MEGALEAPSTDDPGDDTESEFTQVLCDLGSSIEQLAMTHVESKVRREQGASHRRGGLVGGKLLLSMSTRAQPLAAEQDKIQWSEAVQHLNVMLSSATRAVRLRAASTVAVIAECSSDAKEEICAEVQIVPKLVDVMSTEGLEAISALAVLTTDNPAACDQAREAGAISILANYININRDAAPGGAPPSPALELADRPPALSACAAPAVVRHGTALPPPPPLGSSTAAGSSSTSEAAPTGGSTAAGSSSAGASAAPSLAAARMAQVPVAVKAEVVASLRNIANSTESNREAITREQVRNGVASTVSTYAASLWRVPVPLMRDGFGHGAVRR